MNLTNDLVVEPSIGNTERWITIYYREKTVKWHYEKKYSKERINNTALLGKYSELLSNYDLQILNSEKYVRFIKTEKNVLINTTEEDLLCTTVKINPAIISVLEPDKKAFIEELQTIERASMASRFDKEWLRRLLHSLHNVNFFNRLTRFDSKTHLCFDNQDREKFVNKKSVYVGDGVVLKLISEKYSHTFWDYKMTLTFSKRKYFTKELINELKQKLIEIFEHETPNNVDADTYFGNWARRLLIECKPEEEKKK